MKMRRPRWVAALLTLRASAAFLSPASSGAAVRSSLRPLRAADTALAEETPTDASADVAAGAGGEGAAAEGVPLDPAAWRRGWQGAKAEGAGAVEAVEGGAGVGPDIDLSVSRLRQ